MKNKQSLFFRKLKNKQSLFFRKLKNKQSLFFRKLKKKSKKLLLITHPFYHNWIKYPIRGVDRYNYELVRNLKERGFDFEVIDSGFIKNHIEGIFKELIFPFKILFKKSKLYNTTHPMGAKWAIITRKKPLIMTIHDVVPLTYKKKFNDWGIKYKVKSWSIGFGAKYSDHIIATFKSTKDTLVKRFNINPEKISVIHPGVDLETYFPKDNNSEKEEKIIFFVGELSLAKGVDTLIKSTSLLLNKNHKVRLILGSNGKDKELLINLTKELKMEDKVDFVGRISEKDLPDYYRNSDISIFPSRYGFGLATLESMACGVPTLAGRSFDSVDFIDDDRILINPEDSEDLSEKMENVLYNEELRKELIEYGLKKAKEYSWKEMTDKIIKLYSRFI